MSPAGAVDWPNEAPVWAPSTTHGAGRRTVENVVPAEAMKGSENIETRKTKGRANDRCMGVNPSQNGGGRCALDAGRDLRGEGEAAPRMIPSRRAVKAGRRDPCPGDRTRKAPVRGAGAGRRPPR